MVIFVLNWLRRVLALAALGLLALPLFITQGCRESHTYTGWQAVGESPWLVSIPLLFIVAGVLTFWGTRRRPLNAPAALVLALVKALWMGAAVAYTGVAFQTLPDTHAVRPQPGGWLVLAAAGGILLCDLAEIRSRLIAWMAWRVRAAVRPLDDALLRFTARVQPIVAAGPLVAGIGFYTWFRATEGGGEGVSEFILNGGLLALAAWWALALAATWGLARGLGWARSLVRAGAWAALGIFALYDYMLADYITNGFSDYWIQRYEPGLWLHLLPMLAWALWSWWTVRVVLGARRWEFARRIVLLRTQAGRRLALVPRCPECGSRYLATRGGQYLVCRLCDRHLPAALDGRRMKVADAPEDESA
jgi:hypothetical protein